MVRIELRPKPGPGGVDDGLPALPSGEPLLHRWFVVAVLVLIPIGLAVIAWAFLSISRPRIDSAARRPAGNATVTHERGRASQQMTRTSSSGPGCARKITLVGDDSARTATRRALGAVCQLLQRPQFATAGRGLHRWGREAGVLRMAAFELTGVDSSARFENGRLVIELNAKFERQDGARAAPVIVHELTHLGQGFPGRPVTAEAELLAMAAQHAACQRLTVVGTPPRGCRDAAELLATDDPLARLHAAGYPSQRGAR